MVIAKQCISELTPYQPGKPIEEVERELGIVSAIKLASNENPLGPSPKAIAACNAVLQKTHYYPDGGCFELKKILAEFVKVSPQQITLGNGSENVLEVIIKTFLQHTDAAIISQYAFLTISLIIKSYGAELVVVPAKQYGHDIKKMVAAVTPNTRMIFIVNPNNPTGTYTSSTELKYLLDNVPADVLVIVDEAYHEYISAVDYPDTISMLDHYPNLVITRTFSKAYGLAGLRLGYAVSSPHIADLLNRARLPFNVNMMADIAARAAILDQEHIQRSVSNNQLGMQQIEKGLTQLGIEFIPSLGNFITFHVRQSGVEIYQKLLQQGIIVRPLGAYEMPEHLRVTIGMPEQNAKFLTALAAVINNERA